jgi:hypothetical protein
MGVLPERHAWSPHQGRHSDFFRNTFEEPCGIATQHATSYEVVMLRPTQGSKEATPSSDNEAPSTAVAHEAKDDVKGDKKRRKQRLQGITTMTDHDDSTSSRIVA